MLGAGRPHSSPPPGSNVTNVNVCAIHVHDHGHNTYVCIHYWFIAHQGDSEADVERARHLTGRIGHANWFVRRSYALRQLLIKCSVIWWWYSYSSWAAILSYLKMVTQIERTWGQLFRTILIQEKCLILNGSGWMVLSTMWAIRGNFFAAIIWKTSSHTFEVGRLCGKKGQGLL